MALVLWFVFGHRVWLIFPVYCFSWACGFGDLIYVHFLANNVLFLSYL